MVAGCLILNHMTHKSDMTEMSLGLVETHGLLAAIEATDAAVKSASVIVSSAELSQNGNTTISIIGELSSVQAAVESAIYAVERVGRLISSKVIARPDELLWKIVGRQKFISAYGDSYTGPALTLREKKAETPRSKPKTKTTTVTVSEKKTAKTSAVTKVAETIPVRNVSSETSPSIASIDKTAVSVAKPPAKPTTVSLSDLEKLAVVKLRQYARTIADLPLKGRQISMANKSQLLEAISSTLR